MRRTPLVVTGTVAGLAGVLVFHTTPAQLSLGAASGAGATSPAPAAGSSGSGSGAGAGASQQPGQSGASSPARSSSTAKAGSSGTRTVTGPAVNYNYGVLSVSVTVSGRKITKVGIASLDDGGQPRSQFIDQQAIPILEQETMQAQSANIQGVSGASYTSAGFQQSLQAALQTLGI
jgi:uncharacterized protein with FMN-binding domain